jgi:hypothetical protein
MCVTLVFWCHDKMNNFKKTDQAVDNLSFPWNLSTALSQKFLDTDQPLNEPFGHKAQHPKSQTHKNDKSSELASF